MWPMRRLLCSPQEGGYLCIGVLLIFSKFAHCDDSRNNTNGEQIRSFPFTSYARRETGYGRRRSSLKNNAGAAAPMTRSFKRN